MDIEKWYQQISFSLTSEYDEWVQGGDIRQIPIHFIYRIIIIQKI